MADGPAVVAVTLAAGLALVQGVDAGPRIAGGTNVVRAVARRAAGGGCRVVVDRRSCVDRASVGLVGLPMARAAVGRSEVFVRFFVTDRSVFNVRVAADTAFCRV